ncbi:MAG: type IV secretion system DNA-binding domain-containing protein, partial [bacterium]|nr:type IV secretion system DNA-binding domain-containing protein [bacterium]
MLFLYLYIIAGVVIGVGLVLLFFARIRQRRQEVWRSFNLQLFLVRFPPEKETREETTLEKIREHIGIMEILYANLANIKDTTFRTWLYGSPPFALEITVPHIGEEIHFYIAVPRRLASSIEKIVQGVFPQSSLEPAKDYNIFNPEGSAVASVARLAGDPKFPIRTYRMIDNDPLRAITNAFSKLQKVGEGAAFQMVARPAGSHWRKYILKFAKMAYEGRISLREKETLLGGFKGVRDVLNPPTKEAAEKEEAKKRLSPQEEELIKRIEGKAGRALFDANIRMVASAATEARAEEIVSALEGSLAQFGDPNLNHFNIERAKGKRLKEMLYDFSFRVFDEHDRVLLNAEELTSVYHFPNVTLETPRVKSLKAREAPSPAGLSDDGILLGYNMFRGEESKIHLTREDRRRHLYVIGQTGTGKTVFMREMIRQDIQNGEGVCVIDPHGDLVQAVLSFVPPNRVQDVIYFDPGDTSRPMGLNMLEYDPRFPEQKTFIVNELLDIFHKLWKDVPEAFGPMFEQYFRNATLLTMEDPSSGNTLLEINRVLADRDFREMKLSRTNNVVVKTFWTQIAEKAGGEAAIQNIVPYISSKFDVFLSNEIMRPIIAQEKSAINFREVMDSKKILLINLSKGRLGDLNSSLIGLIMVGKILMASLSRVDMPEERRNDFYLYIDEFQNVTTKSIATILSEARKYRLDLTLAHQFIGQLEEDIKKAIFGNVGSMVAFRIGSDDAEFMAKQFSPVFGEQDLLNIDNYNAYIKLLIHGQTATPFSIKTNPPSVGE